MSANEILAELPRLPTADLERIYRRAMEMHQARSLQPSPELLEGIDQADHSLSAEGSVSLEEARKIARSWTPKRRSATEPALEKHKPEFVGYSRPPGLRD